MGDAGDNSAQGGSEFSVWMQCALDREENPQQGVDKRRGGDHMAV